MARKKHGHFGHIPSRRGHEQRESHIIKTKIEDEPEKPPVKGKKTILVGLVIIAIIILAGSGIYYYILPRVEVELTTVYHEATGGASSGGLINVNTQIKNVGTKSLEDINVSLEVTDSESEKIVASYSNSYYKIEIGEKEEPRVEFMGNHYLPYRIHVKIEFSADGKIFSREFTYNTGDKEAMNLIYKEKIFEW
jgi:hypothetical protein